MNICHCERLSFSHYFDPDKCQDSGRTPDTLQEDVPTCSQCGEPCSEIEIREHNPDIPGFEYFIVSSCCEAAITEGG